MVDNNSTSKPENTVRVAAAQFAVGADLEANLETCCRMIRKAAECNPDLIVLPEFCNHLSWYENQTHCNQVALSIDSEWLREIREVVAEVGAYVVINCTVLGDQDKTRATSLLIAPDGSVAGKSEKQVYIGHENEFLTPAAEVGPVVETSVGRLGLYACMDGVVCETPRSLALRGGQILCNSLNSFAPDEGSLHIPVRAAENRVFVVAANKVGPLIPNELLNPVSEQTGIPLEFLSGAGESQIVAPNGEVLALAGKDEEVIFADIDPSLADNKEISDGTDLFQSRRPSLYQSIAQDPAHQAEPAYKGGQSTTVAMIDQFDNPETLLRLVAEASKAGAELIVLPQLPLGGGADDASRGKLAQEYQQLVGDLAAQAADALVVTSIVEKVVGTEAAKEYAHVVIGLNRSGICVKQKQLHSSSSLPWSVLDEGIHTLETPFGSVALLSGADIYYPEVFRVLAIKGVEIVAIPYQHRDKWELQTGLVERAAENRLNLVAVSKPVNGKSASFANGLQTDFTVMTEWKNREFDGLLTYPLLTWSKPEESLTLAKITPANSKNKVVSLGTDLIRSRAWHLADALVAPLIK